MMMIKGRATHVADIIKRKEKSLNKAHQKAVIHGR
jgi:hypothetical protein